MDNEDSEAEAKRQKIHTLITGALRESGIDDVDRLTDEVIQQFARISAPSWERDLPLQYITLRQGGIGGGSTTKPGNIRLNIGKLVRAIASGTLTITGEMAAPWTLVIGALLTWDALWSCLKLDISEVHACVIWALWTDRDDRNTVTRFGVVGAVNQERLKFGKLPLSAQEVDCALDDLLKMRCLRPSKNYPDRWWLRERVSIKY